MSTIRGIGIIGGGEKGGGATQKTEWPGGVRDKIHVLTTVAETNHRVWGAWL